MAALDIAFKPASRHVSHRQRAAHHANFANFRDQMFEAGEGVFESFRDLAKKPMDTIASRKLPPPLDVNDFAIQARGWPRMAVHNSSQKDS